MPIYVYQVLLHIPEQGELPDSEQLESAVEEALDKAYQQGNFQGVSHAEVVFEDVV